MRERIAGVHRVPHEAIRPELAPAPKGAQQSSPKGNIAGSRCLRGWPALFEREGKMLKEVKCGLCAEELIAPAWSVHTKAAVRNFWHCTNCGYVFESLGQKTPLPIELAEEFLTAA
jgi:hypothetical protein